MARRRNARLCYYIGAMDIADKARHGGSTHVLEVSQQLSKRGYEVTVVSFSKDDAKCKLGESFSSLNLTFPPFLRGPFTVFTNLYAASRLVNMGRKRWDLIYARASATDFIATFVALLLGIPIVLEVNDPLWTRVSLKLSLIHI